MVVYGYWPYWVGDVLPAWLDGLSHLAVFQVGLASDGSLTSTSRWTGVAGDLVPVAHEAGVKVHLCVTSFDAATQNAVLSNSSKRATLVAALAAQVDAYGADGVNIDFEGMSSANREDLVTFTRELKAATPEVWLALPVIDWSRAYDYGALAEIADGLFIMGYEFHGTWGDPGPNDPLFGSSLWGSYALDWSVADYLSQGAPREKVVMGLPLYGHRWTGASSDVPGTASGMASSVFQYECDALLAADGREWDAASASPFSRGSGVQTWCDDLEATQARVEWVVDEALMGVGFWALGYEGAGFWEMMAVATDLPDPVDTGEGASDSGEGQQGDSGAALDPPPGTVEEPLGRRLPGEVLAACGCSSSPTGSGGLLVGLLGLVGLAARRRP